jgi:hypothetical protein
MDAVQVMRQKAQAAGNLKTTPQQRSRTQDSAIDIEPADPDVVYVPAYDPWLVYGYPDGGLAGMVSLPRNLVWRPIPLVRARLRNRIGSAALAGDGAIGDSIGTTTQSFNHGRYFSGAPRSITGIYLSRRSGPAGQTTQAFNASRCNRPGCSGQAVRGKYRAARGYAAPAARAACGRAPSAATATAETRGAFRRAEAPASVAAFTAAVAAVARRRIGAGSRFSVLGSLKFREMEKSHMRRAKQNFRKIEWAIFLNSRFAGSGDGVPGHTFVAQQPGQKTFSSAEDASSALVAAAQSNDEKAMLDILGPDGKQIVSSGDEAEDAESRANFAQRYQEMHRLVKEPDGTTTLVYRRGELAHAHTAREQRQHCGISTPTRARRKFYTGELAGTKCRPSAFARNWWRRKRNTLRAAQRVRCRKSSAMKGSTTACIGKSAEGEAQSPIGPLVAAAVAEGYARATSRSDSLSRLLFPHSDAPGKKRSRRSEKLHRKRQR